ncbi:phytoene desaturase [Halococcoides cellulosivorans]|uniref:Phytoene desaturase n=2 Tax=Halococcoides cellulosivorans TaxID=1679096 RepID=A0A2R4X4D1_9EURY|nr:phytoene desaturase [Halococcoides cellulosivorans]
MSGVDLTDTSVTIVGAGIGGLSTAAYCADAGADVTVLERHDQVGGVARTIEADGFQFDAGPSWYLMPEVFERFFGQFDRSPDDYYELEELDPQYRVFWTDGDRVTVPPDRDAVREIFESYEDGAGAAFDRYIERAGEAYHLGMDRFVYVDRSRLRDFLDLDVLRSARALGLVRSMDGHVARYFDVPKLQQLLQYTLVFLGGAPHNTPALYSMLAYADFEGHVHYPDGGMIAVVDGIATLARERGATIETGTPVTSIEPTDDGLRVETAERTHETDRVVANAPRPHVERDLLAPRYRDKDPEFWDSRTYGPSAYMLYLGVEGSVDPLAHHTLVLPTDWDPHFEAIFDDPGWPDDPAFYLSVPSQTDPNVAPDGHHALVALVPIAPDLADGRDVRDRMRETILDRIESEAGVDLRDRIVLEREVCVSEFADQYSLPQGTALGLAHTLRQSGPLRPGHRSAACPGLYYAGSFVRPGIGVPMTVISGEHAARAVAMDVT